MKKYKDYTPAFKEYVEAMGPTDIKARQEISVKNGLGKNALNMNINCIDSYWLKGKIQFPKDSNKELQRKLPNEMRVARGAHRGGFISTKQYNYIIDVLLDAIEAA